MLNFFLVLSFCLLGVILAIPTFNEDANDDESSPKFDDRAIKSALEYMFVNDFDSFKRLSLSSANIKKISDQVRNDNSLILKVDVEVILGQFCLVPIMMEQVNVVKEQKTLLRQMLIMYNIPSLGDIYTIGKTSDLFFKLVSWFRKLIAVILRCKTVPSATDNSHGLELQWNDFHFVWSKLFNDGETINLLDAYVTNGFTDSVPNNWEIKKDSLHEWLEYMELRTLHQYYVSTRRNPPSVNSVNRVIAETYKGFKVEEIFNQFSIGEETISESPFIRKLYVANTEDLADLELIYYGLSNNLIETSSFDINILWYTEQGDVPQPLYAEYLSAAIRQLLTNVESEEGLKKQKTNLAWKLVSKLLPVLYNLRFPLKQIEGQEWVQPMLNLQAASNEIMKIASSFQKWTRVAGQINELLKKKRTQDGQSI